MSNQIHIQYAAAARAPLMKSPSIRVPPPVEMPPDIHPLPDSVTPYFVYPFTLEPHILTLESSRRSTLAAHAARREAYLKAREDEKERRRREALHRIAPGFEPQSAPLVPTKHTSLDVYRPQDIVGSSRTATEAPNPGPLSRSAMDNLVDQLAALESNS